MSRVLTSMMRSLVPRITSSQGQRSSVFISGRLFSSTEPEVKFNEYVALSKKLKEDPGNEAKLQLYALYKQATSGPNDTPKPGALDIVGKYKWAAWSKLGNMTKEDAQKEYISTVDKLVKEIGTE